MYSCWFGGSNSANSNSVAQFHGLTGAFSGGWNNTNTNRQCPVSEAITIVALYLYVDTAVATGTYVFAVDVAGSASSAAVTLTGGATSGSWTGSVAVAQDALLSIRSTPSSTPTTMTNIYWVIEYTTAGNFFCYLGGSSTTLATGANNFANCIGFNGSSMGTTSPQRMQLAPDSGTMTRLSVAIPAGSPGGAGKSYALSVRQNDTNDRLTATISNAATAAQATGSIAVAAGDSLVIKSVPGGTPTARRAGWCTTIYPDHQGETWWGQGGDSNGSGQTSDNNTKYEQTNGIGSNGLTSTESARVLTLRGYKLRKLYWALATAPGSGKTRTLTVRDAAADTALAVTISDTNTSGSNITDEILFGADDLIGLKFSASGTPAANANWSVGFVIDVPQLYAPPPYSPVRPYLHNLVR